MPDDTRRPIRRPPAQRAGKPPAQRRRPFGGSEPPGDRWQPPPPVTCANDPRQRSFAFMCDTAERPR
jgi:hypothetical protein